MPEVRGWRRARRMILCWASHEVKLSIRARHQLRWWRPGETRRVEEFDASSEGPRSEATGAWPQWSGRGCARYLTGLYASKRGSGYGWDTDYYGTREGVRHSADTAQTDSRFAKICSTRKTNTKKKSESTQTASNRRPREKADGQFEPVCAQILAAPEPLHHCRIVKPIHSIYNLVLLK